MDEARYWSRLLSIFSMNTLRTLERSAADCATALKLNNARGLNSARAKVRSFFMSFLSGGVPPSLAYLYAARWIQVRCGSPEKAHGEWSEDGRGLWVLQSALHG